MSITHMVADDYGSEGLVVAAWLAVTGPVLWITWQWASARERSK